MLQPGFEIVYCNIYIKDQISFITDRSHLALEGGHIVAVKVEDLVANLAAKVKEMGEENKTCPHLDCFFPILLLRVNKGVRSLVHTAQLALSRARTRASSPLRVGRVFSNCLKILPLWPLSLYLGMGEFPFEIDNSLI